MTTCFDDKVDLQRYAFPENELDIDLIDDIIQGMPGHMHPTLQNAVKEYTTLEDFRRILKNYEKGLRALTSVPRKTEGINSTKPKSGFRDRTISPKPTLPKTACKCGGMHWFKDCPKRNVTSSQVNVRSSANRTPMGRNKWLQPTQPIQRYNNDGYRNSFTAATAHTNIVEPLGHITQEDSDCESDVESSLPGQLESDHETSSSNGDIDCLITDVEPDQMQ
jgi:hypothetical protein